MSVSLRQQILNAIDNWQNTLDTNEDLADVILALIGKCGKTDKTEEEIYKFLLKCQADDKIWTTKMLAKALATPTFSGESGVLNADEVTLEFFREYLKMPQGTLEDMCREIFRLKLMEGYLENAEESKKILKTFSGEKDKKDSVYCMRCKCQVRDSGTGFCGVCGEKVLTYTTEQKECEGHKDYKSWDKGICQVCGKPIPAEKKEGTPKPKDRIKQALQSTEE